MQGAATAAVLDRAGLEPSRSGTAAHVRKDASADVAIRLAPTGRPSFDGTLPQLEAGVIHARIDPEPAGATAALALAMAEAGFGTKRRLSASLSPHDWIVRAIEATVADRVPAESDLPLTVGLLAADLRSGDDAGPILALELPVDGAMIVPLQPALAAMRSRPAAIAACAIVNRTLFLMGPDRMFYEVSSHYWQGDEDESSVTGEYAAQGDEYGGITRAQWDRVYPEWTRRCSCRELREGKHALRSIADGRGRARDLARALLALDVANRAASGNKFTVNLADAIGLDSCAPWGVPLVWSRKENLTAMVLDEMYQLAMQTSCDMSVVAMQFPAPTDPVAMRSFRKTLTAALAEFAAASAACRAMRQLEKD